MTKKIGMCIIGCGHICVTHHVPALRNLPEIKVLAIVDMDKNKAESVASQFDAEVYTTYQEAFEREDLNVVDICTPPHISWKVAIEAIKRGKDVFCEKPMAISATTAHEVVKIARGMGKKVMVGYNLRFLEVFRHLKKILDSGQIGTPHMIRICNAWSGPHGEVIAGWRLEKNGGGVLLDKATHCVDLMRWLIGELDSVACLSSKVIKNIEVEDDVIALTNFVNGALGELYVSWACKAPYYEHLVVELYGTKGSVVTSPIYPNNLLLYREGHFVHRFRGFVPIKVDRESRGSYNQELEHFVYCILHDKEPQITARDALRTLEIVDAMRLSLKMNRTLKIG